MSKLTLEPPSDSDATVAARHLCVLLATERPDLWPALNAASLGRAAASIGRTCCARWRSRARAKLRPSGMDRHCGHCGPLSVHHWIVSRRTMPPRHGSAEEYAAAMNPYGSWKYLDPPPLRERAEQEAQAACREV